MDAEGHRSHAKNRNAVSAWLRDKGYKLPEWPKNVHVIAGLRVHCPPAYKEYVFGPKDTKKGTRRNKRRFIVDRMAAVLKGAPPKHIVYFVGNPEIPYVKIGTTSTMESRLRALQGGFPVPIMVYMALPGGRPVEWYFHQAYKHLRREGEWFALKDELAELLRKKPVPKTRWQEVLQTKPLASFNHNNYTLGV